MAEQSETVRPYVSGHGLARAAALLLLIFAFASLPLVGLSLSNMRMFEVLQPVLSTVEAPDATEEAREATWILAKGMEAVAVLSEQLLRPVMLIGVVAGIVCLFWIYRVHANLPALGGRNLRFTSFWAVGWWFIPFAHFYFPYHVVREIWRESDPGGGAAGGEELGSSAAIVGWWWALTVCALLFGFYYPYWAKATGGEVLGVSAVVDAQYFYVEATTAALNIATAVLGILVITGIDRMQTAKHRQATAGT